MNLKMQFECEISYEFSLGFYLNDAFNIFSWFSKQFEAQQHLNER